MTPMDPNDWFRDSLRQKEDKADGQHKRNSDEIDELQRDNVVDRKEVADLREMLRREMRDNYVTTVAFTGALALIEERYKWVVWLTRAIIVGVVIGVGTKLMALIGLAK